MAFIERHLPCPFDCGSSDAYAIDDAGWGQCFSCGERGPADGASHSNPKMTDKSEKVNLLSGDPLALRSRRISEETCRKYQYWVGEYQDQACHIANYADEDGRRVAQKIRLPGKDFRFIGAPGKARLFGQHLFKGGKRLVITEGEIDCLSYAEIVKCQWACVSVPNGAQAAAGAIKKSLEFVESFEEVVFLFDNDEPGQDAAQECAALLSPGKARIAELPLKDPNEMLQAGMYKELQTAVFQARVYRPDGVIAGADISLEDLWETSTEGIVLPYPGLQQKLQGLRKGELTIFTAGSGVGKTTIVREIGYDLVKFKRKVMSNIFLEESYKKTAQGYIAIDRSIPLGELRRNPNVLTREEWEESRNAVVVPQYFYNHFGSLESDNLISKIRYYAVALGVDFVVLDHISMVVSGQEGSGQGERKDIDVLMTKLRSVIEQTGVGVIAIVHLKRPDGKRQSFNEGGQISLSDLRGSASIEQLSDNIIAVERDQQSDEDGDISMLRVLKNREWGRLGPAGHNKYHVETGRLLPHDVEPEDDSLANDFADSGEDVPFDI